MHLDLCSADEDPLLHGQTRKDVLDLFRLDAKLCKCIVLEAVQIFVGLNAVAGRSASIAYASSAGGRHLNQGHLVALDPVGYLLLALRCLA
ncbi:hypothetical protein A1F94_008791 [Pyrenophora tritici-repentis]|nr:hypothetical protein A1F94_008791 [Pyrenophora tritici-repentis]